MDAPGMNVWIFTDPPGHLYNVVGPNIPARSPRQSPCLPVCLSSPATALSSDSERSRFRRALKQKNNNLIFAVTQRPLGPLEKVRGKDSSEKVAVPLA